MKIIYCILDVTRDDKNFCQIQKDFFIFCNKYERKFEQIKKVLNKKYKRNLLQIINEDMAVLYTKQKYCIAVYKIVNGVMEKFPFRI